MAECLTFLLLVFPSFSEKDADLQSDFQEKNYRAVQGQWDA